MSRFMTPAQKAANALKRAEEALRNWQDDADSPRADVDKLLLEIDKMRSWVQAHVEADIERAHRSHRAAPPIIAETPMSYDIPPRRQRDTDGTSHSSGTDEEA